MKTSYNPDKYGYAPIECPLTFCLGDDSSIIVKATHGGKLGLSHIGRLESPQGISCNSQDGRKDIKLSSIFIGFAWDAHKDMLSHRNRGIEDMAQWYEGRRSAYLFAARMCRDEDGKEPKESPRA